MCWQLLLWLWRRQRRQHRLALAAILVSLGLLLLSLRWTLQSSQPDEENFVNPSTKEPLVALGPEPQSARPDEVAVVVLASSRPEVQLLLRQLMASRPSEFRILVSQDGAERRTAQTLSQFDSAVVTQLRFSSSSASDDSYTRISRHHLHVLDYVFLHLGFRYAIVMEDDLVIAPDFYSYFRTLRTVLDNDPTVFCVSAWNDNGLTGLVTDDATMLHRTDFFPGLGWMISKSRWSSVRGQWPNRQFDDFLRKFMIKEGLACVIPELSRTFNTGRCGGRRIDAYDVYGRAFYHNYLSRMALNHLNVTIPNSSINRVLGRSTDKELQQRVRDIPEVKLSSLLTASVLPASARVSYRTAKEFVQIALQIGIVPEVWFGSPRASVRGIVSISIRGCRVFIAPDSQLPFNDDIVSAADNLNLLLPLATWGTILLSFGCLLGLFNLWIR